VRLLGGRRYFGVGCILMATILLGNEKAPCEKLVTGILNAQTEAMIWSLLAAAAIGLYRFTLRTRSVSGKKRGVILFKQEELLGEDNKTRLSWVVADRLD